MCVLGMYVAIGSIFLMKAPQVIAEQKVFSPRDYLREKCVEPDCDFWMMDKIAECESGWTMVKNSSSSAYGFYQILDSTERTTPQWKEGMSKYDPYANIEMGVFLFESRGWQPWYPSRSCWSWKYAKQVVVLPDGCIGSGCSGQD